MKAIVLAVALAANGVAKITFQCPGHSGSWSLQASSDTFHWRVLEAGPASGNEHVTWTDKQTNNPARFYRVQWTNRQ